MRSMSVHEDSPRAAGEEGTRVSCPLCGAGARQHWQLAHTAAWQCAASTCGLEFAWPQLDDDGLRQAYGAFYYPTDNARPQFEPTSPELLSQFFLAARERTPELRGQRLLDYGCGTGLLCRLAGEQGMLATGIEADPRARAGIQRAKTCTVYASLAELRAAEPEAAFDWIVLWEVIEHLREPWNELARLCGIIRPGGTLVVTTPNARCLKARLQRSRWEQRLNPTHFYYFTANSLRGVLSRAGFAAVEPWRFPQSYPHHGWLRRQLFRVLQAYGLQGGLVFSASVAGRTQERHFSGSRSAQRAEP